MAMNGQYPWPPAGNSAGRLRGSSYWPLTEAGRDEPGPVEWAKYKALQLELVELKRENEFLGKVSGFFAAKQQ